MASRLTVLQTERNTLTQELAALQAQIQPLLAQDGVGAEQIDALRTQISDKRTAILAKEQEIAGVEALIAEQAHSPAVTTHSNPLTAIPAAERDPRRGFLSIGHFARGAYLEQLERQGKSRMDRHTAELMAIVRGEAARENAQFAAFSAAAPTPLHQEGYSEDGLMVPPDFRQEIWKPAFEADDLLALFNPQTTSSRVVVFAADETTPWGAAGIKAYWIAEGGQKIPSKLATKPRQVDLHKIAVLTYTTDELLQDTALLTSRINEQAPRAIGWEVSEAFIRGNGVGKPLGFEDANYAGKVVQAKESGQAAATIYAENILKMAGRIHEGPGSRILWLAHRTTIPQLAALQLGEQLVWLNTNMGLREAPNGTILGNAVRFSQHANTLGQQGDISLLDLSGYAAFIHSSGTKFDSSIHLYFDYDITAFRWVMRVGGMPYLTAPISPRSGSTTTSHFVQLAVRA